MRPASSRQRAGAGTRSRRCRRPGVERVHIRSWKSSAWSERLKHVELLMPGSVSIGHNDSDDQGFAASPEAAGRSVLLVDDTFTSGARIQTAASALRRPVSTNGWAGWADRDVERPQTARRSPRSPVPAASSGAAASSASCNSASSSRPLPSCADASAACNSSHTAINSSTLATMRFCSAREGRKTGQALRMLWLILGWAAPRPLATKSPRSPRRYSHK